MFFCISALSLMLALGLHFLSVLAAFGRQLGTPGPSWDALGTLLGGSWDALGRSWDALGASSGRFGQPLRPLRRYSEHLVRFRDPPLPYLAPFG